VVEEIHTETSILRTFKIMPRNLNGNSTFMNSASGHSIFLNINKKVLSVTEININKTVGKCERGKYICRLPSSIAANRGTFSSPGGGGRGEGEGGGGWSRLQSKLLSDF
jgi:hypothetical protein